MKYRNHLLSILIGLAIVFLTWQRLKPNEVRIPIDAIVTDIVPNDANTYQIHVSFNPKRHETHQVHFKVKTKPTFAIGDSIRVAYRANNTEDVKVVEEKKG